MSDNPSEPGWQTDPTGRHEYRYWDGTTWTDNVADGGATSTDPHEAQAPAEAPAQPSPPPPPPVVFQPALPTGTREGRSKGPLLAVIAIAVVAAGVVAFLVLGGDDNGGGGVGKSTVEVPKDGVATKTVSVGNDQVLLITVAPQGDDIDPIVGLSIDPDSKGARDLASYFSESTDEYTDSPEELSDVSDRPEPILGVINRNGPGDDEADYVNLPRAIDVTLVFGDATGEGGKLDIDIQVIDVKAPDESSDYHSALCDNDEFASFADEHDVGQCDGGQGPATDVPNASDDTDESS